MKQLTVVETTRVTVVLSVLHNLPVPFLLFAGIWHRFLAFNSPITAASSPHLVVVRYHHCHRHILMSSPYSHVFFIIIIIVFSCIIHHHHHHHHHRHHHHHHHHHHDFLDGQVRLWNTGMWSCVRVLGGHTGAVHDLAWSIDDRTLVCGVSHRLHIFCQCVLI